VTAAERRHGTHPKDTDSVKVAVRGTVGLDHAEHAVELPVDEKDNEQVVRVPDANRERHADR
jgi:hypothetical protein